MGEADIVTYYCVPLRLEGGYASRSCGVCFYLLLNFTRSSVFYRQAVRLDVTYVPLADWLE